ncbi:phosphatase PAP2 family protein [Arabiibacter massiliensis]|uniref:hypothetical protein n=1 Tax=Arabiibacter massiliensis TaxID=1870985 RepID=UPI0009BBAC83|nr:hypothetical protein [Arabiibacter massiliensis]
MKKSNWIIMAVLAVAAGAFLWLWYYLGFNFVDDPFDLVLAIVYWALVIGLSTGIHFAEKKRRQRVRTVYVSDRALFNSEAGLLAFQGEEPTQDDIAAVLYNLKYDFTRADEPDLDEFDVKYLVRTEKFDAEQRDEEAQLEAPAESQAPDVSEAAPTTPLAAAETVPLTETAAEPADGEEPPVEPKEWKGEVVVVKTKEEHAFETPEELAAILARLQQAAA